MPADASILKIELFWELNKIESNFDKYKFDETAKKKRVIGLPIPH